MMVESDPPEPATPPSPIMTGKLTVLQLSSFTFLLPAMMAFESADYLGTAVLLANELVCLYVHRKSAVKVEIAASWVNTFAVTAWVVYTGGLFIQTKNHVKVLGSLMLAVYITLVALLLGQWPWRSPVRTYLHASMHCAAAAATALLLM